MLHSASITKHSLGRRTQSCNEHRIYWCCFSLRANVYIGMLVILSRQQRNRIQTLNEYMYMTGRRKSVPVLVFSSHATAGASSLSFNSARSATRFHMGAGKLLASYRDASPRLIIKFPVTCESFLGRLYFISPAVSNNTTASNIRRIWKLPSCPRRSNLMA